CSSMLHRPPTPPLFPYTTLFRSEKPRPGSAHLGDVLLPAYHTGWHLARKSPSVRSRLMDDTSCRRFFLEPDQPLHRRYAALRALDRKSTRLNSSHVAISYAVFCL